MGHVPLGRVHEVVVAALIKIALLSLASVHESHIGDFECDEQIRLQKIAEHPLRMHLRVAHDIRHAGFLPRGISRRMARLAGLRADVSRCRERGRGDQYRDGNGKRETHLPDFAPDNLKLC